MNLSDEMQDLKHHIDLFRSRIGKDYEMKVVFYFKDDITTSFRIYCKRNKK